MISLFSSAQEGTNIHNIPYIEVTGEGKMEVSPDEIYLSILIDEGDKGRVIMERLERDMIKELKQLGIDTDEQLKVLNFGSDFKSRILGQKINTSKQFELLIKESKRVPQVFVKLEDLGISNINLLRVDHSKREEFELEVKVLAVRAAKKKAELMLAELDNKVGKTLYVQENSSGYYPRANNTMMLSRGQADYESLPDLDFRTMVFQAGVQVRFGIE